MGSVVLKFGGTSVQDEGALQRLVGIVGAAGGQRIVVVSALAGVTNALVDTVRLPDSRARSAALASILDRHFALICGLTRGALQQATLEHVIEMFRVAASVLTRSGPVDAAARDAVLAVGELASSRLVAAVLAGAGIDVHWVDARRVIVTDDRHGAARPLRVETRDTAAREIARYLTAGRVAVVGGFVGATRGGLTTTLGRGGSDYSAAIVAAAVDASRVEIWTDVDGLLSADPRVVPGAIRLDRISGVEAYDLARFGARVLHAGTLEPVAEPRIPVLVRNSRRPTAPGTEIAYAAHSDGGVAGLAHRREVSVVDLVSRDLGTSAEFLDLIAECVDHGASHAVTPVAVSPQRAIVALDDEQAAKALTVRAQPVAEVASIERGGLVAVVGHGVQSEPGVWRAFVDLRERAAVHRVVQSSSGCALVAVTAPGAADAVLRELHDRVVNVAPKMEVA
jgi:aspartate kinase